MIYNCKGHLYSLSLLKVIVMLLEKEEIQVEVTYFNSLNGGAG
jgi:hypothetical protein